MQSRMHPLFVRPKKPTPRSSLETNVHQQKERMIAMHVMKSIAQGGVAISVLWITVTGAAAGTIDFNSGYTPGSKLEDNPDWTTLQSWVDGSWLVEANAGPAGTGDTAIVNNVGEGGTYRFTTDDAFLGGNFDAESSTMDYQFDFLYQDVPEQADNNQPIMFFMIGSNSGNTVDGAFQIILRDAPRIVVKAGDNTQADLLPADWSGLAEGEWFTISGQIDYDQKTFTMSFNGTPVTVGGEAELPFLGDPADANIYTTLIGSQTYEPQVVMDNITLTLIPEPGTTWLLGIGSGLMLLRGRNPQTLKQ